MEESRIAIVFLNTMTKFNFDCFNLKEFPTSFFPFSLILFAARVISILTLLQMRLIQVWNVFTLNYMAMKVISCFTRCILSFSLSECPGEMSREYRLFHRPNAFIVVAHSSLRRFRSKRSLNKLSNLTTS